MQERIKLYQELEAHRGRPLIVYVTTQRQGVEAEMALDVIPEFLTQLEMLPKESDKLDLLIVSNGGDPTVAWRIVSLIRERVTDLAVLVPQAAFSAATLVALGANQILMHPNGNLGPTDPQIKVRKRQKDGNVSESRFGAEDLGSFLEFAKKKVGLSDQAELIRVFELFCTDVGATAIGVAARGSQLSLSMGEKLLHYMFGNGKEQEAKLISQKLNTHFFHHGYALSRKEAKALDLKIAESDLRAEDLIWRIWCNIEANMQMRCPFSPLELVQANPNCAALFAPIQQFSVPMGVPLSQQLLQQIQQSIQVATVPPTKYEIELAILESPRRLSHNMQSGLIQAVRTPDLHVQVSVLPIKMGWKARNLPSTPEPTVPDVNVLVKNDQLLATKVPS